MEHANVKQPKKSVRRPNTGNALRSPANTPRKRFLETDVTEAEHQAILDHCLKRKISMSQFLADLIFEDAEESKGRKDPVFLRVELTLTAEQFGKLQLLAHLRQKENIQDLIQEVIQPYLDLKRLHAPAQTKFLRFYLSKQEHARVSKHMAGRGLPARKYVSFLAMKKIVGNRKGR
jgi:hypothetical protein